MSLAQPVTLQGARVTLVPLSMAHHEDLCEAVRDGELWKLWYTSIASPDLMACDIENRLSLQAAGSMLPFAVLNPTGQAVGMTTYLHIDAANRRLEIGATWYRQAVQRSALNTECKALLLTHAFEALDCIAVELRTHFMNHQSRRGIERLGAKLDGVLRSHQINRHADAPGTLRDTCVYSITAAEWPTVKAHLTHQLGKPRAGAA
ncbi:GNAT family N-acetyltransferase [Hydrogenophaga sp.]|uniref:GNAT family N-acetyltransferase n=1 Tax=Hydrogenophaga sp. TaxID=1904254 RepID=UPI003F6B9086